MIKFCILFAALAGAAFGQLLPGVENGPPPPDTVIAKVNGQNVTIADVRKMLETAPPQLLQAFKQNPRGAIQQYFMVRYLAAEGEKQMLAEKSPLKDQLELVRAQVLAGAMVNQERDGFAVTGDQIDAFYARNELRYQQAKIRIIFVRFKPGAAAAGTTPEDIQRAARQAVEDAHDPTLRTEADAAKIAAEVIKKLRDGGDFKKLVEQYSDDPTSKAEGGEFGVVKATSPYAEDMKRAIFALKVGDVSDPIRQSNGFYIVQNEEKTVQPINEVREAIVQEMRQAHLDDFMKSLTARFQPVVEKPEFFLQPDKYLAAPKK